jgi:hypothetical protein
MTKGVHILEFSILHDKKEVQIRKLPMKLSTTIQKIGIIPHAVNREIINEFLTYMKNNGSSEHHQNNNLKVVIAFGCFLGKETSFMKLKRRK